MKKVTWLIAGLLSLLVTACSGGSYSILVGGLDSTPHSISGSYSSFSGHYFRTEKFTQGEHVLFQLASHTEGGSLTAELLTSSGQVVSTLTGERTIVIPQTNTYRIQVQGDHHHGDFMLTWSEVGAN